MGRVLIQDNVSDSLQYVTKPPQSHFLADYLNMTKRCQAMDQIEILNLLVLPKITVRFHNTGKYPSNLVGNHTVRLLSLFINK